MNTNQVIKFLFLVIISFAFGQEEFNPNKNLKKLTGKNENIGIAAAYSIDGETNWSKVNGFLCEDKKEQFSTSTLTRIASIAKNFTAVAIMQLVENKQIELDDSIGKYLTDIPDEKKNITVKLLLAHTSGIPQYQNDKEVENMTHYKSLEEAMQVFINRPLLFNPGTKYFYTSYGYVVLGRIIEVVTSMTYENYMNKHIFSISEMNNTVVENINENYSNKSCLYHNKGRKAKERTQNDLSNRIPGGGFLSTVEDLIKFGNALVEGKLIKKESLDQMLEVQPVEYDGNKYGLGWYLYGPPPHENLVIGHSGGQTGCTSQLMIIPKSKTVIVVLSNTSGNYPDIATFTSNLITYSEQQKN